MTLPQSLLLYGLITIIVDLACVFTHFRFFGKQDLNLDFATVTIGGLGITIGIVVFIAGLVIAIWNLLQSSF